jgi:hypothetical protein
MKRIFVVVLSLMSVILITGAAYAGNINDPGIQGRIAEQQGRIDTGIASGQLTRPEAAILQDNLTWIKNEEARLKADGHLTPHERKRLNRMLDRNSNMIHKKKHNPIKRVY